MQNYFNYQNKKIAYSLTGKGQTIILLHGFLENSSMWKDYIPTLSLNHNILTIDLPGHGNSECIAQVHTMEIMADIINCLLKELRIGAATLIGHSMGGYVALAFAEQFPSITNGIVLINSTAQEDSEERKKNRLRAVIMTQTNYKALVTMSITNLFNHQNKEQFTTAIENCKKEALTTSVSGYTGATKGMLLRKNRENIIKQAPFKKLYIIGKNDTILNAISIKNEAIRTNTNFLELETGHMSPIENKQELQKILIEFVKIH